MARGTMQWRTYVPQRARQAASAHEAKAAAKRGEIWTPVRPASGGRNIATTVWGTAWCDNLERYHDYENRLPRGRAYIRNGSVVHLDLAAGRIAARVRGSELYRVEITIAEVAPRRWKAITAACATDIGSLVDLLDGRLSAPVMAVMTARGSGLFPEPREISMTCSCPDWATMCKHVAAVMYGVGVRLDAAPALLFVLRGVDPSALVTAASTSRIVGDTAGVGGLELEDLGSVFGIELVDAGAKPKPLAKKPKPLAKKPLAKPKPVAKRREITRKELLTLGVSVATISGWYSRGVLESVGRPGVYRWTKALAARIAERVGGSPG